MKQNNALVLLCLLFFQCVHSTQYTTELSRASDNAIHKNGFLVGLGASAAFILSQWLFSESDQQLVARAEKIAEETYKQYEDMITYFSDRYHIALDSCPIEQLMQTASEQEIYDLALCVWNRRKGHIQVQQELIKAINNLSSMLYTLDTRENQLEEQHFYSREYEELIDQLRQFIRHILFLREKLNLIKRYITIHVGYFALFDLDGEIRNKYRLPIEYVSQLQNNHYACALKIREWALSQEGSLGSFHTIVRMVRNDIISLQKTILAAPSTYEHRISTAQQLRDLLIYIKSVLTIDPLYSQETAQIEWQQIQQQNLQQ